MTVKEHTHASILRAIADGKQVQWKHSDPVIGWVDFQPNVHRWPGALPKMEWRIKPEKQKRWVNIYSGRTATLHFTREDADKTAATLKRVYGYTRQACLAVEFEEGEGL